MEESRNNDVTNIEEITHITNTEMIIEKKHKDLVNAFWHIEHLNGFSS